MSTNEVFEKKAGVKYVSIPLTKLSNGGWTDRSVSNPVWKKVLDVGQVVIVSSREHPDPECRFTNGRRGSIIEPAVKNGVVGYYVSVMGSMLNENSRKGTGYFVDEEMVTVTTPLDQRINLSLATDEELSTVRATLQSSAWKVGNGSINYDRAISEIKEKRPFKHGWKGICGLVNQNGESYGPEVKKEKIYFFTELTQKWLANVCVPGDGAEKTKAFKKWLEEGDGCMDRSWNENLDVWQALPKGQREYYYDIVRHAKTLQEAALKVKNAEQAKASKEAAEKREADRAAGVGRGRRATAAAADEANTSKRRRK